MDSGFWIPIVSGILDSLANDSRFHRKNCQDSGNWIPLHGVTLTVLNMTNTVSSETKNETQLSVKDIA